MPFEPDPAEAPQTATATSETLGETLRGILRPEVPADALTRAAMLPGYLTGTPTTSADIEMGRTVQRHGWPIVASMYGAGAGGVGALARVPWWQTALQAGATGAGGEALGETMVGEPLSAAKIGLSGALSGGLDVAGRAASGLLRAGKSLVGQSGAYRQAAGEMGSIPYPTLRKTVDEMTGLITNTVGTEFRPVPTATNKLSNELAELTDAINRGAPAAGVRNLLSAFIQGNQNTPQAYGLYGAFMSDLRAAAATSPAARQYLESLTNDAVARALVPDRMIERLLLYGGGMGMAFGHPETMLPSLGLLGYRALSKTPPSLIEPLAVGGGQLGVRTIPRNPFSSR